MGFFVVIIIVNALSNPSQPIFSVNEIYAIAQYVYDGHGLIVTGGTLRSNGSLAFLLGYSSQVGGQTVYGTLFTNQIEIIDSQNFLFTNLPEYQTYPNNATFYSGQDWANDGGLGHLSDWQYVLTDQNAELVGKIRYDPTVTKALVNLSN